MSRKHIGYTELEWGCPNCGSRNAGSIRVCQSCGAPQPEDVQFEQAQGAALLKDEASIERAKKGADIHCPYCGGRNPGEAATCQQCGGSLAEGARRASGRALGAFQAQARLNPIACPGCGTENPGENTTCLSCGAALARLKPLTSQDTNMPEKPQKQTSRWLFAAIGALLILGCALLALFALRTHETTGLVREASWERSIVIQKLGEITLEAWRDELPAGAQPLACAERLRATQDEPAPGSREICGTPYSVDTGSGFAEVVQDCVYEVYADYCEYIAKDWMDDETLRTEGRDYTPYWPQTQLTSEQREGERVERYRIYFETDEGIQEFSTSSESLFMQLQPGTQWILERNALGAIISVRQ